MTRSWLLFATGESNKMYISMYINICKGYPKYFFHCLMAPKSILVSFQSVFMYFSKMKFFRPLERNFFKLFEQFQKLGQKKRKSVNLQFQTRREHTHSNSLQPHHHDIPPTRISPRLTSRSLTRLSPFSTSLCHAFPPSLPGCFLFTQHAL